jgi:hypothetical protein
MVRLLSFAGTCVLLFSFTAIGIGAAPARASTVDPVLQEFVAWEAGDTGRMVVSFEFLYRDWDGDGMFSLDELVLGSFRLFRTATSSGEWYGYIVGVPETLVTHGSGDGDWAFDGMPEGLYRPGAVNYSYVQTAVPIPPSALLLGAGLIPLAWARRKKRLGK